MSMLGNGTPADFAATRGARRGYTPDASALLVFVRVLVRCLLGTVGALRVHVACNRACGAR
eukprot:5717482-Alexandrium_andersonii.AAC.1